MFFSGLFQRKSDAPVTTPAELADAIGLSYDTYTVTVSATGNSENTVKNVAYNYIVRLA